MTTILHQRVSTGIRGLDVILDGGLIAGHVYVVRGQPGAGKTILANQICFNLATNNASCTFVSVLAEASDRMLAQMSRFHFYRPQLVGSKIYYVAAHRVLQEGGIARFVDDLRATLAKQPSQLLVIDGLHTVRDAAVELAEFKRFVHDLQALAMLTQSTILLLSGSDPAIEVEPEHTLVDGIIELTDELTDMRALRHVHIRKMRGASQLRGKHTITIDDAGITVMPRAELRSRLDDEDIILPDPGTRVSSGIDKLDRMLGGGLPARSVTMLVGPTGSGKTTIALHYIAAGARADETALYFGFYERPRELLAKAARVGIPLEDMVRTGNVHFAWQAPIEGVLDVLAERVLDVVHRRGIRRLCIDGMHTFGRTIDYPDRLPDALASLETELQRAGVTTVYTLESAATLRAEVNIPLEDVSATSHNIIMLRHVEADAEVHRLISVMKVRECPHDMRTYEFQITERGVVIADTHASASDVLARRRRNEP